MNDSSDRDLMRMSKIHGHSKRKASSSIMSPDKPKRFKSEGTFIAPLPPGVKSPEKQKKLKTEHVVPSPTPSVKSSGKRKRLSSDDTSSLASCKSSGLFSLTNSVAYGAHEDFDESDLDYDTVSQMESEKPMNFMKLDTSQLSREHGVLFSEDLTDDYEIWTLQCSNDVDVNELLEQSINFNGVSTLKVKNSLSSKVDLIPYRSQEDTTITVVIPSEETSNLSLKVVPLSGTLIMSNGVKKENPANQTLLPVDTIEDATRRRSELMSRITKRLSNKIDVDSTPKTSIKNEFIHKSPKKVKDKNKHKLSN